VQQQLQLARASRRSKNALPRLFYYNWCAYPENLAVGYLQTRQNVSDPGENPMDDSWATAAYVPTGKPRWLPSSDLQVTTPGAPVFVRDEALTLNTKNSQREDRRVGNTNRSSSSSRRFPSAHISPNNAKKGPASLGGNKNGRFCTFLILKFKNLMNYQASRLVHRWK